MMKSSFYSFIVVDNFGSSGAWLALPMVVTPEAIVELYLFEYRLEVSSGLLITFVLQEIFSPSEFFYRVC
jgi:hypothetical protein